MVSAESDPQEILHPVAVEQPVTKLDTQISIVVRNKAGEILANFDRTEPSVFPAVDTAGFSSPGSYRVFTYPIPNRDLVIQAAETMDHRFDATVETVLAIAIPLFLVLPFAVVATFLVVDRTIKPVLELGAEIGSRDSSNLSPLQPTDLAIEIQPLAQAVNELMERVRLSLQAERSFAANSAHELRTPIAGALAQTQLMIASLKDKPEQKRAQAIEAALKRLTRISEKLMQLARAERTSLIGEKRTDLAPYLAHVIEEFHRNTAGGDRLDWTPEGQGTLVSSIDPEAFAILARNLIDNALRHGSENQPVRISVPEPNCLSISNACPAIPAETLDKLLAPFERGATETEGSGLGLAIVRAITDGVGATLSLASPAPGQKDGFEVRVKFRK